MNPFLSFLYNPKKKEVFEQLPLYIEEVPSQLEDIVKEDEKEKDYIIIVDIT